MLITDLVCIASFFFVLLKVVSFDFFFFTGNLWVFFYAIHVWNFLWVISVFWVCFVFVFVLLLRKSSGFFLILINMDGNGYSEIKFCNINTWTRNQNFYPNLIGYKPNLKMFEIEQFSYLTFPFSQKSYNWFVTTWYQSQLFLAGYNKENPSFSISGSYSIMKQ